MAGKDERDLIADRAESFGDKPSPFAARNVLSASLAALAIGGYFALKAAPATSQDSVTIPDATQFDGDGRTGIFEGFEPLAPVDSTLR